jgi:hypothetical protein
MHGDATPVLFNQIGNKVTILWFAESGTPVTVNNNDNIVSISFLKEDAGSWKEPIADPTLTDVEFNDAYAVSYVQPRMNLPQLVSTRDLDVRLYPNPASKQDVINLSLVSSSKGQVEVQIIDALGRIVGNENLPSMPTLSQGQTIEMSLGTYSPGSYSCHIRVKAPNGEVKYRTLPFIIKN